MARLARTVPSARPRWFRHTAVVAGPHHDVGVLIEVLSDLVRMQTVDRERNHTVPGFGPPGRIDPHPVELLKSPYET